MLNTQNSPETKTRITIAIDKVAAEISGGQTLAGAAAECAEFMEAIAGVLRQISTPEKITEVIDRIPEITTRQLAIFEGVCVYASKIYKAIIVKQANKHIDTEIPSTVGRPTALSSQQSREICEEILRLFINDVSLTEAKKKMARHYKVSLRLVDQVWSQKKKFLSGVPIDEEDARQLVDALTMDLPST